MIMMLSVNGLKYVSNNIKSNRRSLALDAYCLNVNLYIKPERRTEFLEVIKQNAKGSRTLEPKCKLYVWGESTTTANLFHFQEIYDDIDGFKAHTSSPHFAKWSSFASTNPFTKEPEVFFFEEI